MRRYNRRGGVCDKGSLVIYRISWAPLLFPVEKLLFGVVKHNSVVNCILFPFYLPKLLIPCDDRFISGPFRYLTRCDSQQMAVWQISALARRIKLTILFS